MRIEEALKIAAKDGHRAFAVKGHDTFGFVITKAGNILALNKATFGDGITVSFEYRPNQATGSGCACQEGDSHDFGIALKVGDIEACEKAGLAFAKRLGAPLYKSSDEWLKTTYWKNELEEVIA